ncbi:MAG: hypothetical protein F6K42_01350 [Leptolyngbya sp. SIO1D8]|nr:hypothetical protein [Leptolyngbya sp. SIO1D8]
MKGKKVNGEICSYLGEELRNMEILQKYDRESVIGSPTYWKISNLGIVKYCHDYDSSLLAVIKQKALDLKSQFAHNMHKNHTYIRGAQKYIPEILELHHDPQRLAQLEALAGTSLEPYPISVITSSLTYMSPTDGAIDWHSDGTPVAEIIPLAIDALEGGELQIYRGHSDIGLAELERDGSLPSEKILSVKHQVGHSVFGQFMGLLHRVKPVTKGYRISLNMTYRSKERPYLDNNHMWYLGADNPEFEWQEEYLNDVREKQLPAYLNHEKEKQEV